MAKKNHKAFYVDPRTGRIHELRAIVRHDSATKKAEYRDPEPGEHSFVGGALLHDPSAELPPAQLGSWHERGFWLMLGMATTVAIGHLAGVFP